MSGARANAAARRRRADSSNLNRNSSYAPSPSSNPRITNSPSAPSGVINVPKMTPTSMLLSHHKIIDNLQTVIENLNSKVEVLEKTILGLDNKPNSGLNDKELKQMKDDINEVKDHNLKVQKFSIEMNLNNIEQKKILVE
uniref:Uncharacterized protein n=1 Tax=Florenciella sp. virus SA2 TaxID=3240092 RepID=A0AB39JF66_9VIRU